MAAFSQPSHHHLRSAINVPVSADYDHEKKPTPALIFSSFPGHHDHVKETTHCSSMGDQFGAPEMLMRNRKKASDLEEEKKGKAEKKRKKKKKKVVKEVPTGYVHVRARRGEATDSHSLAERARREKISERMKLLQSLVPGCDKIIGKTLVLDEIINYVRSLQNQVEFLVGKLASINPMLISQGESLNTNTLQSENLCGFAVPPPPPILEYNSNQLNSFSETPLTSSFLLQHDHVSSSVSQNDGMILWDMNEQEKRLLDQHGFSNIYSF